MKRYSAALVCLLVASSLFLPSLAAQQSASVVYKGNPGPVQGVWPNEKRPTAAGAEALGRVVAAEREPDKGGPLTDMASGEKRRLKSKALTDRSTGGTEIHLDGTPSPLAPNVGMNFNGLGQNGWIPYDAAVAVGPNHVVAMTNSQWVVWDRNGGVVRAVTGFGTWWPNGAGTPFDPKCFYDAAANKFVMVTVSENGSNAFYHLSISQTGDPTGLWWNYDLSAKLDGSTNTNNWGDFPNLGYDDNAVYVTSNQFSLGANIFQYAKIRVLKKTEIYAGQPATWTDFVNMSNADLTKAFTMQPARTLTPTSSEFLINNKSGSGNIATLWRIDNPTTAPTLTRIATLTIGAYSVPPDAPQPNTATLVATNDSRLYDTVWQNGELHTSFGEAFSGLAAVRYLRVSTGATPALLKDISFTQPGVHYYFPAVTVDAAGNIYLAFSRSSSTEFASLYHTGMQPADSAMQASALVKAGASTNTSGRWGDYNAIANDPANNLSVVLYAGWANTGNQWATWVANASFAGSGSTPTLSSISPNSGTQSSTVAVTLTGTNFVSGATVGVSGTGVTVNSAAVVNSTTMTANFVIAAGAPTGARNVTVTTTGGTSNGASFTVNAAPPAPTLTTASPNRIVRGQTTNIALTGTNFISGATVNVAGSGVTIQNVVVVNSTTITADFVVAPLAAVGDRAVTVTTTSGTSNAQNVRLLGVPVVTSITPVSGNRGSNVSVTILGSNFNSGNLNISGTGVTFSNVMILNNATKITATFAIAANAPPGPRDVTVSNLAGVSNAVIFTVNGPLSPPTLTSVSPNSGNANTTVPVTLSGEYYVAGATVNVSGGGVTVSNVLLLSSTVLTANFDIAAAAAGGARTVTVTTTAGTSSAQTFTVNGATNPPVLMQISPSGGQQGQAVNVTITGQNTNFVQGTSAVNLSGTGVTVSNVSVASNTSLTAVFNIAGNAPTGAQNITVITGAEIAGGVTFAVNAAPVPTLNQISPNSGTQGTTVPVTLSGLDFISGATVNVSGTGITVNNAGVVNATTITANFVIAAGAATGARSVTVTTTGGTSNGVTFTVNAAPPAPTLTLANPNRIVRGVTTNITFTGTNFLAGARLNVAGTGVTVQNLVVVNITTITADFVVAPLAAVGDRAVTVTTTSGTSNAQNVRIHGVPVITSISPSSGNRGTNVNITVLGSNFNSGGLSISGTGITISNVMILNNATRITATLTISAGATTGPRDVTVSNIAGTSNAVQFNVN